MKQRHFKIVVVLVAIVCAFLGFFVGQQTIDLFRSSGDVSSKGSSEEDTEEISGKRTMTSKELAHAKHVPATITQDDREYALVAVVEGADANRKMARSMQMVSAQRQRLMILAQQYDNLPATSHHERDLAASQINGLRKSLGENLRFMAENFAYSLDYNYVLVPHEAALLAEVNKEGKASIQEVYQFKTTTAYDDCQRKREAYLKLKQAQLNAAKAAQPGDSASTPVPSPEPTPEMKEIRDSLLELYHYDPEKNYRVDFLKTAIYATRAR